MTVKDISIKFKYIGNKRRLQMSLIDKDSYGEIQIDVYHNITKIYVQFTI